jgi:hypothetical protein
LPPIGKGFCHRAKRRLLLIISTAIALSQPITATVVVYTNETDFLTAALISSTENFDQLPSNTGYFSTRVVIDQVRYEVDGPCLFDSIPNPCWAIGTGMGEPVTPPNGFGATFGSGPFEHRIGFGGYVRAFGFWFLSGGHNAHWEIIVHEVNGTSTFQDVVSFSDPIQLYFGFLSDTGIRGLTVRDFPGGNFTNWSYDNVSRSEIVPEAGTVQMIAIAFLLAMLGYRVLGYSTLSAVTGSVRATRNAGNSAAPSATRIRIKGTAR